MRTFNDIADAYLSQINCILLQGQRSVPRDKATIEILASSFTVESMMNNVLLSPVRDLNYRFMIAEWFWIMAGSEDLELLARFNSHMREFSDDGIVLAGAYGPRILSQIGFVLDKLKEDPWTRQAVMTIWKPNPLPSRDIPCTISLQFLLRESKMHLIVTMRSSDVWLGLPYDFFTFSQIGNFVAGMCLVEPGSITMQLGSSHLYEQHLEKAKELSQTQPGWLDSPKFLGKLNAKVLEMILQGQDVDLLPLGEHPLKYYVEALHKPSKAEALEVIRELATKFR
jgi:thymidylate synthase